MRSFFAKYKFFALVLSILSLIIIFLMYDALRPKDRLPVYQPNMVNPELVDSTLHDTKKYHTIADFNLINQNGDSISHKDYENKIYIADFFFTTCPFYLPYNDKKYDNYSGNYFGRQ